MDNREVKIIINARDQASATIAKVSGSVKKLGNNATQFLGTALATGAKVAAVEIAALSFTMGDAIKRVDTLNNFPRVMSNMKISAKDARETIDDLSNKLKGLPTSLDVAALSVQRLTTKTEDVKKAKDIFLALNNAVIAGGAPMNLQANALEQFSQAFAKGKPDMMEWRSIMTAMPAQLTQLAIKMKQPSADALGEALRDGSVSMEDFAEAMVDLNIKGVDGYKNFAAQAKNSTAGIGTSLTNLKISTTRALANVLNTIGQSKISGALNNIAKGIDDAFKKAPELLKRVADAFKKASATVEPFLKPIKDFVNRNSDDFKKFLVLLIASFTVIVPLMSLLAVGVGALLSPFSLLAVAVAGLSYLFIKNREQITEIANRIGDYLYPKLQTLWATVKEDLIPVLKDLWKNVIQPMIPVIGVILVASIGFAIDALNLIVSAFSFLTQSILDGNPIIWGLIGVFGALKAAMAFNAVFNALKVGFTVLRLITIPNTMASLVAFRALAMSPMVMGALGIGAAVAAILYVHKKLNEFRNAFNQTQDNIRNASNSSSNALENLVRISKEGTPAQQARAKKAMNGMAASGGFAAGGFTGRGGTNEVAGVVHKGEYVVPKSQVDQSTGMPNTTQTVTIGTIVLGSGDAVKEMFRQLNQDGLLVGKGLAPGGNI
jgi:tape measure domain-containing protein